MRNDGLTRGRRSLGRLGRIVSAATLFVAGAVFAGVMLHESGSKQADSTAAAAPGKAARHATTVHNDAELAAAIRSASGGDTISLAAGSYSEVRITRTFSPALTIKSVRGQTPVVGGFFLDGASGVHVKKLATNGESDVVDGSHDVSFDHLRCTLTVGD